MTGSQGVEGNEADQEKGKRTHGRIITGLNELPPLALLDEAALADLLGVTKRTIRRMVRRGELPPPIRLAGRATWQAGRVLAWCEQRAEQVAREARRHAQRFKRFS